MRVERLADALVAPVRKMLWDLFDAVAFVLLMACANLASLMLARAATRRTAWSMSEFLPEPIWGALRATGTASVGKWLRTGKHRKRVLDRADRGHAKGVPGRDRCYPSRYKGSDRPADQLSWFNARSYCEAVGMRLPSEVGWERGRIAIRLAGVDRVV
jgi:Sulfatase-modifying factor enzyme 1